MRDGLVEIVGRIRRTDRIKIPLTGVNLPRMHIANMRYGTNPQDVVIERWWSLGNDIFKCYDTGAMFEDDNGAYSVLPAKSKKWRYMPLSFIERIIDIWRPYPLACYLNHVLPRPPLKEKHRLVQLLAQLNPDDAVRHWQRFEQLGAFA